MKYVKYFLRGVIIIFLGYCVYSNRFQLDSDNWLNKDLSVNIPNIIGTYIFSLMVIAVSAAIGAIGMFVIKWIFENKKQEINNL